MEIPRITWAEFDARPKSMYAPAIIADEATQGEGSREWTPQLLKSVAPDRLVVLSTAPSGRFSHDYNTSSAGARYTTTHMSLSEATDLIVQNDGRRGRYVMQHPAATTVPELLADAAVPPWLRDKAIANIWFGSNTVTPLHFDYMDNFFLQVYGEKTFILFPPDATKYLYPRSRLTSMSHASRLDPEHVDLNEFPAYAKLRPIKIKIGPRDVLYLPCFWWHQVRSDGVSISISYWTGCEFEQFLSASNSARALVRMYQIDGLQEFEKAWLNPHNIDFMLLAENLIERNRCVDALPLIQAHLARKLENATKERENETGAAFWQIDLERLKSEADVLSKMLVSRDEDGDNLNVQFASRIIAIAVALRTE